MTLTERLQRRLRNWRDEALRRRALMDDHERLSEAWWLQKSELAILQKCVNELAADLMASSDPEQKSVRRAAEEEQVIDLPRPPFLDR